MKRSDRWSKKLFEDKRVKEILERLCLKALSEPRLVGKPQSNSEVSLRWILDHQGDFIREYKKFLRGSKPELDTQKLNIIYESKERKVYVSPWPDRILLSVMASILTEESEGLLLDNVHSFRKGKSTITAIDTFKKWIQRQESSQFYLLKRDVSQYGDSIPQDKLLTDLHRKLNIEQSSLFGRLLQQGIQSKFRTADEPGSIKILEMGVPSGSPIVPALENFYLSPLDEGLAKLDGFYARYGDDFIFATVSESVAEVAMGFILYQIQDLGLSIKPEKKEDLFLSQTQHPKMKICDRYLIRPSFKWLGKTIHSTGLVGCKPDHLNKYLKFSKIEIDRLARKVYEFTTDPKVRIELFTAGIRDLTNPKEVPLLQHLLRFNHNSKIPEILDTVFTHRIHQAISNHWNFGKRDAWKIVRKIKRPAMAHYFHTSRHKRRAA